MNLTLTDRDFDLLETLTLRVRILTLLQCAQLGWPQLRNLAAPERRMRRLVDAGLIESQVINALPPTFDEEPLVAWQPDTAEPDAVEISQSARQRAGIAARPTTVYVASARGACLFGGSARGLPSMERRERELRLAAVYVRYRRQRPQEAAHWVGNAAVPKAGDGLKDFDASLHHPRGWILRVIHCAGRYAPRQVERFHDYCFQDDLPYELW